MTHVNIPAIAQRAHPVVQIHDGQAITISTEVARVFGKQHKDVLRAIQNLRSDLPGNNQRNFAPVDYTDEKGERRPAYHLTRDGFTLLAMGFTGKRALAFKLAYIDAFNKMEAALLEPAQPAPAIAAPAQKEIPMSAPESHKALLPAVAETLLETWDCERSWDAWYYGTMGQDDFSLVRENPERLAEITNAALDAVGFHALLAERDRLRQALSKYANYDNSTNKVN